MSAPEQTAYLAYHEPDIVTILVQSSFLLLLNVINHIFDQLTFCGLVGQIFVGVAWGTPGGKLLGEEVEDVLVQLGYLGLVLIVYEGGLQTSFKALKDNAVLSTAVAFTGIAMPISLSFSLQKLINASPLQSFAAGAALSSTSLGTTFTILSTSGLSTTRLGTILTSAAMMDDVVGLVMVQVISNLGDADFHAVTVVRPIFVAIGLAIAVIIGCRFVITPTTLWFNRQVEGKRDGVLGRLTLSVYTPFIIHTSILLGLVTGASYAGTSNLFAAYLAGASISWWDIEVPHITTLTRQKGSPVTDDTNIQAPTNSHADRNVHLGELSETRRPTGGAVDAAANSTVESSKEINSSSPSISRQSIPAQISNSGPAIFHTYFSPSLQRVLKPLFFASIGFAIPITELFSRTIVWRGIVYTILMLFAKLVTGLWLVRLETQSWKPKLLNLGAVTKVIPARWRHPTVAKNDKRKQSPSSAADAGTELQERTDRGGSKQAISVVTPTTPATKQKHINKPLSLYPAAMLGTAMTARGEIGFLIASLADTTGVFASTPSSASSSSSSSEIYLIVTWAIVLCTIIGPLAVGTLVKRVRRLDSELEKGGKKEEGSGPLGIWGVH